MGPPGFLLEPLLDDLVSSVLRASFTVTVAATFGKLGRVR